MVERHFRIKMPSKQNKSVWMHACRCRAQSSWPLLIIFREKQFGSFLLSPVAVLIALGCCQVNARKPPPETWRTHADHDPEISCSFSSTRAVYYIPFKNAAHSFPSARIQTRKPPRHVSLLNTHTHTLIFISIYVWNTHHISTDGLKFVLGKKWVPRKEISSTSAASDMPLSPLQCCVGTFAAHFLERFSFWGLPLPITAIKP